MNDTAAAADYNLRPRRPPFRLVESVGMGVTSSANAQQKANTLSATMSGVAGL